MEEKKQKKKNKSAVRISVETVRNSLTFVVKRFRSFFFLNSKHGHTRNIVCIMMTHRNEKKKDTITPNRIED